MRFLLDTNTCIYIIKQKPPQVVAKFQTIAPADVGISSITLAELEYGVFKSQRQEQNRIALKQFTTSLTIIPFGSRTTEIYGQIRADLERQGIVVGALDLLIASQAISSDLCLVTNNVRELSRIPGLTIKNWVT